MPPDDAARARVPLLGPVLQMAIPDTELTAQMTSVVRAENTDDLMLAVIGQVLNDGPIILVIDDCQWMDTASWRLLRKLQASEQSILLILGVRSERENAADPITALLAEPSTEHIQLSELDQSVLAELVASILGIDQAPDAVIEFARSRGGGNPYLHL